MAGEDLAKKIDKLQSHVSNLNQAIKKINENLATVHDKIFEISNKPNNDDVDEAVSSLNETVESIEEKVKEFEKEQCDIKEQCNYLQQQLCVLQSDQQKFNERLIRQETYSRRDNLVFEGIPEPQTGKETDKDCWNAVMDLLVNQMEIKDARHIKVVRCHRVGPPPSGHRAGASRPRSIMMKLHWYGDRQMIWDAKYKLKNTRYFVNEDFPAEIIHRRKQLLPIMKKAWKLPHMKKAYLSVDKLHLIDNSDKKTVFDVNTLHRLPADLDPRYITTVQKNDCFAFFGQLCPLSNFHPAPITHNGQKFKSVEQMYQFRKAEEANDDLTAKKIMEASSSAECKLLGDRVRGSPSWDTDKVEVMKQALYLKYSQNRKLRDFLVSINASQLAEASPNDLFWGTGRGLGKEEATQVNKWKGKNTLGKLLTELRADLKK